MNVLRSLKLLFRNLLKKPAFAAVVIFTFAIATSASIFIYSYIDALILTPIPFKDPEPCEDTGCKRR